MPALFGYNAFSSPEAVEEALQRELSRYGGGSVSARNVPVYSQGGWGGIPGEYEVTITHPKVPGESWTGIVKGAPNETMMIRSGVGWNVMLGDIAPANEQGLLNPSEVPYYTGVESFAKRISASFAEAESSPDSPYKRSVNAIFQQMNVLRTGQKLNEYTGMGGINLGVLPPQSLFVRPEEATATNIRHLTQRYNISHVGEVSTVAETLNRQFNDPTSIPRMSPGEAVSGWKKLAGGYSYANKYFVPPTAHGEEWLKPLPEAPGQFEPAVAGMTEKIWKHKHIMGRRPVSPFMAYRPEMGQGASYQPGRLLPVDVPGYTEPESVTMYSGDPTNVGMRMTAVTPVGSLPWQSGQAQISLPEPVRHRVVNEMGATLLASDAARRQMNLRGASVEDLMNLSVDRDLVGRTLDPGQRYTVGRWGGKPSQALSITASQQIQQIEGFTMHLPREWAASEEMQRNIEPIMRHLEGQGIRTEVSSTLEKGPYLQADIASGAPIAFKGGAFKPQVNIPFIGDIPMELRGTSLQASPIPYNIQSTTKNWDALMLRGIQAMPIEGRGGVHSFMRTLFPEAREALTAYEEGLAGGTPSMRGFRRAIGGYETGTHLLMEVTNRALQTGREFSEIDQDLNRRLYQQFGVGRAVGETPVQQFTPETRRMYRRQLLESLMTGDDPMAGNEALRVVRNAMRGMRETSPGIYTQYMTGEKVITPYLATGVTETGGVGSQATQFDVDAILRAQGFSGMADWFEKNRKELFPTSNARQAIRQAAYAWQTTTAGEVPRETSYITVGEGGLDPGMIRAIGRERTAGMTDYERMREYGNIINELAEQPPGTKPRMLYFPKQGISIPHPASMATLEATSGEVAGGPLEERELVEGTGSHLSTKAMKVYESLLGAESRGTLGTMGVEQVTNLLSPLLGSEQLFKERGGMFSRGVATSLLEPSQVMLTEQGMERQFFLAGGERSARDRSLGLDKTFRDMQRQIRAGVLYRPPGTMLGTEGAPGALQPVRIMTPQSRLGTQITEAIWKSGIMQPNVITSQFEWASQGDADVDPKVLYAATYLKGDKWYSFMQGGGGDPQYKDWLGRIQKYLSPESQRRAMEGYYGEFLKSQMPWDEEIRKSYMGLEGAERRLEAGRAVTELTQVRQQTEQYNVNKKMGMGVTYNTWIRRSEAAGAYLGAPDKMTRRMIDLTAGLPYSQAVDMSYVKRYWESLMNSVGFAEGKGGNVILGGLVSDNPQAGDWGRLGIFDPHKPGGGERLTVDLGYMLATDRGANPEGIAGMLLNYPAGMEGTEEEVAARMQPRLQEVTKRLAPLMKEGEGALYSGLSQMAEEGLIGERSFAVTSLMARSVEWGQRDPVRRRDLITATGRQPIQLYGKEWQWEALEKEFAPVNQLYEFAKRSPTRGVADMHLEFRNLQGVGGILQASEEWSPGRQPNIVSRLQRSFGMHFPSGRQSDVDPAYIAAVNRSYERVLRQADASRQMQTGPRGPGAMLPPAVRAEQVQRRIRSRAGTGDATPEEIAAVNAAYPPGGGDREPPRDPPVATPAPADPGGRYGGESTGAGAIGNYLTEGDRQRIVYTEPKPLPHNYADISYQQAQEFIRTEVGSFAGGVSTGEFTPGRLTEAFRRMPELIAAQFPQEYRQKLLNTPHARLMAVASELAPQAGVDLREITRTGAVGEAFRTASTMKNVVGLATRNLGGVSSAVNDIVSTGMMRALSGHPGKITGGGEIWGGEFGEMSQTFEAWNKIIPGAAPKESPVATPTQMGMHQRATGIDLTVTEGVRDFIGSMEQFKKVMNETGNEVKTSSENLETFSKVTREELGKLFSDEGEARIQKAQTNLVKAEAMRWQAAQAVVERFPAVGRPGPGGRLSMSQLADAQRRAEATGRAEDLGLVSGYTGAEAAAEQQLLSATQQAGGGGGGRGGGADGGGLRAIGRLGRRMFGGFGLMYMRSIAGIITGGAAMGYGEGIEQRAQIEGAVGARFGGMAPMYAPEEEVTRAQAMYGGFGWGGLRTLQANMLRQPGMGTLMGAAQAGVGAGAAGAWMAMMMPELAPLVPVGMAAAAAGTVGLTAYGAAQQPALTGVNLAMERSGVADRLQRSGGLSRRNLATLANPLGGNWLGTLRQSGLLDLGMAAVSPANLGYMYATLTGDTQATEVMQETQAIMTEMRAAQDRGQNVAEYLQGRTDFTEGQRREYLSLYTNWRVADYPTIPMQGLAQGAALEYDYGLRLGEQTFGTLATGLAQGIPYEQLGMAVGYTPLGTMTEQRQRAASAIESWLGRGGLKAEDIALLQKGGTRYEQLGVFAPTFPMRGARSGISVGGYAPGTYQAVTGIVDPYRSQEQYTEELGELGGGQWSLMAQQARIAETFRMAGFDYAMPRLQDFQGEMTPEQYQRRYQQAYPYELRAGALNQWRTAAGQLGVFQAPSAFGPEGPASTAEILMSTSQYQFGMGVTQTMLGGGMGADMAQGVGAAFGQMTPSQFGMYSGMMQGNPLRWAQWAQERPGALQALTSTGLGPFAQTMPGIGGNIPIGNLFMTDVGPGGNLTGLPWGTTSLATPLASSAAMGNMIFGANAGTPAGQALVEGGRWGLQRYQLDLQAGYQATQAGIQLRRIGLQREYQPQFWDVQDRQRELGYQQQEWQFDFRERQMEMQNRHWEQNFALNQQQARQQRTWTRQDWGYQDQVRGLQWGWRVEDFGEQVRFMTGRQRRLAERQMRRDVIMHGLEGDQIDRRRARQEEIWDVEDKRFDIQRQQHEEALALQQEQLAKQREFFEERKALEEEMVNLQREYWEKNIALTEEAANASAAYASAQQDIAMRMQELQEYTDSAKASLDLMNKESWAYLIELLEDLDPILASIIKTAIEGIEAGGGTTPTPGIIPEEDFPEDWKPGDQVPSTKTCPECDQPITNHASWCPRRGDTNPDNYQRGGRVRSGQSILVGETGPEKIVMSGDGYVVPSYRLNPWEKEQMLPDNLQGRPQTVHMILNVGGHQLAELVTDIVDKEIDV